MRRYRGVFNTDRVNRDNMQIPASALMNAEESNQRWAMEIGIPPGLPSNRAHDQHRPIGWAQTLGVYIDSQMVSVLGDIYEADTEAEKRALREQTNAFREAFDRRNSTAPLGELTSKLAAFHIADVEFLRAECFVASKQGLAAAIFPEFFIPGTGIVDKDGLVDYRALLARTTQLQPGVFHDTKRDLVLFAHRFHRRSLSHRNKLNDYCLKRFDEIVQREPTLTARLRLDPDLVGTAGSVQHLVELEYWRGPHFDEDIVSISDGVTEHRADDETRRLEGIDRTQFWWKAPETRRAGSDATVGYRTFEIEELIENPSGGLPADSFGCRYAHAEFSSSEDAITHFDGAIRAYEGEQYLQRFEASLDRAGKHATYTKLFRLDGALPIADWKRLLTDFFRGNPLVPEYLGATKDDGANVQDPMPADPSAAVESHNPSAGHSLELAALISLQPGGFDSDVDLIAEQTQQFGEIVVPFLEVGRGAVAQYLRGRFDVAAMTSFGFDDGVLNMSRMIFGPSATICTTFRAELSALSVAVKADVDSGLIQRASIPFAWERDGLITMLTIAGDASKVAATLERLGDLIDPSAPAEKWVQPLSDLIKSFSDRDRTEISWTGVDRGVLEIPRSGEPEVIMKMPEWLQEKLRENGILRSGAHDDSP